MRICLSSGGVGGGGIGMVMLQLAEDFRDLGHQVDILNLQESTERRVPDGVNVVELGARTRYALPATLRYLRTARPDVIFSARDYINLLMLCARALRGYAAPRPVLVWGYHTFRANDIAAANNVRLRLSDWLSARLLHRADARVAVSHGVANGLATDFGVPSGVFEVVENPVWTPARLAERLEPCPHPWLQGRAALKPDPSRRPILLAIGRLCPQKDFPTLITAMAQMPPDTRLIILGEGDGRASLRRQIVQLGLETRIDLAGNVDSVLPYLSRADLFVSSSRWEGFPLALVEALGSGCPIVATDCPAGPAEILENGLHGALAPVGQPDALSRAMLHMLANPGDPEARMKAAHRFTARRAALRYLALAEPHLIGRLA